MTPDKQTGKGQSRIEGGVEVGLEIDGCLIDTAVAVGRGDDGGVGLIGSQRGVLDIEELGADFEDASGLVLATVHPGDCTVADNAGSANVPLDGGEAELVDDIPKDGCVVGVEDNLVAVDGGARGAGHAVDGLGADETGELVVLLEALVVGEDSGGELADGGGVVDGEGADVDAALGEARGGLRHHDAGEGTARDLIGCEDCTAIETRGAGDVDLDTPEVGLNESVVNAHLGGQPLKALAEHTAEEFEDGSEVGPLGADVHLSAGAERSDRLDGCLAHNGTDAGLTVYVFADFAADFGVDSEDFCHSCSWC